MSVWMLSLIGALHLFAAIETLMRGNIPLGVMMIGFAIADFSLAAAVA